MRGAVRGGKRIDAINEMWLERNLSEARFDRHDSHGIFISPSGEIADFQQRRHVEGERRHAPVGLTDNRRKDVAKDSSVKHRRLTILDTSLFMSKPYRSWPQLSSIQDAAHVAKGKCHAGFPPVGRIEAWRMVGYDRTIETALLVEGYRPLHINIAIVDEHLAVARQGP